MPRTRPTELRNCCSSQSRDLRICVQAASARDEVLARRYDQAVKRAWTAAGVAVLVGSSCAVDALDYTGKACPCPAPFDACVDGKCRRGPTPTPVPPATTAPDASRTETDASARGPRRRVRLTLKNLDEAAVMEAGHSACLVTEPAPFAGKTRPDFGDLRVVGPGGERPRVVDLTESRLSVCFRIERAIAPGSQDDAYALVYDDPLAEVPGTRSSEVFDFADDFDGPALDPRWMTEGSPTMTGGVLKLPADNSASSAIGVAAADHGLPLDVVLELKIRIPNMTSLPQSAEPTAPQYTFGFLGRASLASVDPSSVFVGRLLATDGGTEAWIQGMTKAGTKVSFVGLTLQRSTWRIYGIQRAGTKTHYHFDRGVRFSGDASSPDTSIVIRNTSVATELLVDWVRAYPSVSGYEIVAGPEELLR